VGVGGARLEECSSVSRPWARCLRQYKHLTPVNHWIISFPIKQPLLQPQKNGTCSSCPAPPASLLVVLPLLVPPPPPPGMFRPRSVARLRLDSCSGSFSPLFWPSEHDAWNGPSASRISPPHPRPRTRPCGPPRTSFPSTHTHEPVRPRRLGIGPRVALDGRILGENVPITRSWSARKRHARRRRVNKAYETHERTRMCTIARAHTLLEKVCPPLRPPTKCCLCSPAELSIFLASSCSSSGSAATAASRNLMRAESRLTCVACRAEG
jgi:hypothetical protein